MAPVWGNILLSTIWCPINYKLFIAWITWLKMWLTPSPVWALEIISSAPFAWFISQSQFTSYACVPYSVLNWRLEGNTLQMPRTVSFCSSLLSNILHFKTWSTLPFLDSQLCIFKSRDLQAPLGFLLPVRNLETFFRK